ncbi:MAG: glycerophosphodiester phosphodiesterase [Rhodocyclaceae bacterium]|nr:glycerophosphodiester phosphodiesterase [Rhodocyclaceae bacterium]
MSPPSWRWPRILAHRCGGALAPENSLVGLERARAAGCRAVEFDAMLAACGTPVVIHDETLARTTEGAGRVDQTPWSALSELRLRDRDGALTDERLPALHQVLDACQRLGLMANVEIKPSQGRDAQTGQRVAEQVARWAAGAAESPVLSSFSEVALAAAAQAAPGVARALLLELPDDGALTRAHHLGCVALIINVAWLDAAWIAAAHGAGLGIACYTENDAARGRAHLAGGLDALITDWPDRFAAIAQD